MSDKDTETIISLLQEILTELKELNAKLADLKMGTSIVY